jgi:hypothetical protein
MCCDAVWRLQVGASVSEEERAVSIVTCHLSVLSPVGKQAREAGGNFSLKSELKPF